MQFFSVAQCLGYVAFVLGVTAFLQKEDRRLKGYVAAECLAYTAHFWMLGNVPASLSAFISSGRTLLSLRTRSPLAAGAIVVLNILMGLCCAKTPAAILPVASSCLGTVAVFRMRGIPMRLVLFVCTCLWLANNILSGSIGGTLLESFIAVANAVTIFRLSKEAARPSLPAVRALGQAPMQ
jgi:hypothetical protein